MKGTSDDDAATLRRVARRLERLAQRTYDKRDRVPNHDNNSWRELNAAATALSKYGLTLTRRASSLSRKPPK